MGRKNGDLSRYQYNPENKKDLELNNVIFRMRDFRPFIILVLVPVAIVVLALSLALIIIPITYSEMASASEKIILPIIGISLWLLYFGGYKLYIFIVKKKDETENILKNAKEHQIDTNGLLEEVQKDLNLGIRFLKGHNLMISNRYVIGSLSDPKFNPIIIPIDQIDHVEYDVTEYYDLALRRFVYQRFYFHTTKEHVIKILVNDKFNPYLALNALQASGIKTVEKKKESDKK